MLSHDPKLVWKKKNSKAWCCSSGFIICNESFRSHRGRVHKIYFIYKNQKDYDLGKPYMSCETFHKARAEANKSYARTKARGREKKNTCKRVNTVKCSNCSRWKRPTKNSACKMNMDNPNYIPVNDYIANDGSYYCNDFKVKC